MDNVLAGTVVVDARDSTFNNLWDGTYSRVGSLNTDPYVVQVTDPAKLLADAVHLIQNLSADDNTRKTIARAIIKRIQRIHADVQKLFPGHDSKQ